jgi:thiol:disulfide interchange protein DsbC
MLKKILPLALLTMFCLNAAADEAEIRKSMESRLGTKVESVNKSGYLGLYEVYADGNIFYTDESHGDFGGWSTHRCQDDEKRH